MAAGRPPLFETDEQLNEAVNSYFEYIKGEFKSVKRSHKDKKTGEVEEWEEKETVRDPEPPTITGLALHLGFASRQSFYDYEKDGEFSYTIKRARLVIEKAYEHALHGSSPAGAIFALKNFGWSDKQEIDHTSGGKEIKGFVLNVKPPELPSDTGGV